jgi:hypothetical protein
MVPLYCGLGITASGYGYVDTETNETTKAPNLANRSKTTMLFLHSHSFSMKILGLLQITERNQSILLTEMIMKLPQINIATHQMQLSG